MKITCDLYRVHYMQDRGYLVYRRSFKPLRCTFEEWACNHQTAAFIRQDEAQEYANHRNLMVDQYGSDKLPEIA